jgi:hypothetical protein
MGTESLVIGGDLGGTSTRIVVVGTDGRECGRSVAGGGNPISHPAGAAAALAGALGAALAGVWWPSASRPWPRRRCGTCAGPASTWSPTGPGPGIA